MRRQAITSIHCDRYGRSSLQLVFVAPAVDAFEQSLITFDQSQIVDNELRLEALEQAEIHVPEDAVTDAFVPLSGRSACQIR